MTTAEIMLIQDELNAALKDIARIPVQFAKSGWNRCGYCGQFIGFNEFAKHEAEREMVTPDTAFTAETYETYHARCHGEQELQNAQQQQADDDE